MTLHFATFTNACAQLYNLWLSTLPIATAALLVYSLACCYPSLWVLPPTQAHHRGRQEATAHTPVRGPFQPATPRVQSTPIFCHTLWIVDNIIQPTMNLAWLAINTVYLFVGKVNYTFSKPNLETYVAPIKIRIQQRIAQVTVPTIPNAPALSDVPYRYICPTVCLATLLAVLVLTVGVSAKLACLVCFVVCAIAIAGDRMGVVEEEEGPQVGAGLTAAPHEQT